MIIIDIKNINKTYKVGFLGKKKKALEGLNLQVEKGETFGYLGPNGAGKTTTLKILLGLVRPDSGSATILGQSIENVSLKSKIGFLPEQPYFYDYLTGKELLEFYASFFGLGKDETKRRIADLLRLVSLSGYEGLALKKYSKGMLQRIGIAQALINDPEIIFLDEPMSGLDPIGRKEVKDIILNLKNEGKTIFFCSHVLPDVEMLCDRVAMLNKGHLTAIGDLDDLLFEKAQRVDIEFKGLSDEGIKMIKDKSLLLIQQEQRIRITIEGEDQIMEMIHLIDSYGGTLLSVIPHRKSLEDIFVSKLGLDRGIVG